MPGPIVVDPTPSWLKPENASVTDSALTKALRMIGSLIGADNPTAQVMGLMMTEIPGGPPGGLAKAVTKLKERAIKAYHGSPHDFEKFSLEKIGTGEGAQAYGHGLYFAENPATAKAYREQVSSQLKHQRPFHVEQVRGLIKSGVPVDEARQSVANGLKNELDEALYELRSVKASGPRQTRNTINPVAVGTEEQNRVDTLRNLLRDVETWPTDALTGDPGKMYEVAIHADPDDFLDWDKPLSQQSEKVRTALGPDLQRDEFVSAAGKRLVDYSGDTLLGIKLQSELRANGGNIQQALESLSKVGNEGWKSKVEAAKKLDWSGLAVRQVEAPGTGQNLINDLQRKHTPEGVNTYLKSKGIPGIKYLDQGSRISGDAEAMIKNYGTREKALEIARQRFKSASPGDLRYWDKTVKDLETPETRNYVVFDDKLIDILKKYGLLLPAAGGASQLPSQQK